MHILLWTKNVKLKIMENIKNHNRCKNHTSFKSVIKYVIIIGFQIRNRIWIMNNFMHTKIDINE